MRIGIDIGGTFTDFTVVDEVDGVTTWKEDSTPSDPLEAIVTGLNAMAEAESLTLRDFLGRASLLVHGTTAATNLLIQRKGPRVGLVCTQGFRDIVYFRDGYKPQRFDLHLPHPGSIVDRWLRLGVQERVDSTGTVIVPLDEESVREVARNMREAEVDAVAVALLWSIVNPVHERRVAEILREEMPDAYVICSNDVLPEMREWERTSATVLSAYILPRIGGYLDDFQEFLRNEGLKHPPLIMQINGGCSSVHEIMSRPINILASGPAAAPAAARRFREVTGEDVIIVDMGGTSFDVCLINDGEATMSRFVQVEDQPIGVPAVHIHSVGAGGGSIAHVDSGGALCVGPQSAGASPGPACYNLGGSYPTVTDANVVLGYLNPEGFLSGRRILRRDLSEDALVRHVGTPLGIDLLAAAAGVIAVVNSHMSSAIRAVSVEQGIDPRRFTLLSGGGAGGLHAAVLARHLGIRECFIPHVAGVLCSFGMTETDVRHDFTRAMRQRSYALDLPAIDEMYSAMESEARRRLLGEGFDDDSIDTERWVDARYPGQHHELTVQIAPDLVAKVGLRVAAESAFHGAHTRSFGWANEDSPVEFLHWRTVGFGKQQSDAKAATVAGSSEPAVAGMREIYVESVLAMQSVPFYRADDLFTGNVIAGPAIIESPTTTILIPDADQLRVLEQGYLISVGIA